jgi:hypothetical protein
MAIHTPPASSTTSAASSTSEMPSWSTRSALEARQLARLGDLGRLVRRDTAAQRK